MYENVSLPTGGAGPALCFTSFALGSASSSPSAGGSRRRLLALACDSCTGSSFCPERQSLLRSQRPQREMKNPEESLNQTETPGVRGPVEKERPEAAHAVSDFDVLRKGSPFSMISLIRAT